MLKFAREVFVHQIILHRAEVAIRTEVVNVDIEKFFKLRLDGIFQVGAVALRVRIAV